MKSWHVIILLVVLYAGSVATAWLVSAKVTRAKYTVEAPLPDPVISPAETVKVTFIKRVPVVDTLWRAKYDSLLASFHGNKDTAAAYLAQPWAEDRVWGFDRSGVRVAGRLGLISYPLLKMNEATVLLDTLRLPPPKVVVETETSISLPWMISAIAVGSAFGYWLGRR